MTDSLNDTAAVDSATSTSLETNATTWHLDALTAALGDLTLTVEDSLSIGRGSDNDVVLGSKEVSRNHALLSVLNGQLYAKDLNSSNGTFINEERIESNKSKLLKSDDTLGFASFTFKVTAPLADKADSDSAMPASAEQPVEQSSSMRQSLETNDELTVKSTSEPVVKETIIGEVLVASANEKATSIAPTQGSFTETDLTEKVVLPASSITAMPSKKPSAITSSTVTNTPIEQETAMSNNENIEALTGRSVAKETVNPSDSTDKPLTDTPLTYEKGGHQEAVVSPEHDKTTKTALQEEADPDILRAKQAATAQFSGTANLGQSHDVGTQGNNAMDQAINNPANAGQVNKKPSGSWFIWVFIALIIIGLALWLFNTGGTGT